MFEALLGPIIGSVAGGLLGGSEQGGTQTQTREPWQPAQDWIKGNIAQGQQLQNYYTANPFNALQTGAYQNLFAQNDFINQSMPSLMQQFNQQVGFSRANPTAQAPQVKMPVTAAQMQVPSNSVVPAAPIPSAAPQMAPMTSLLAPAIQQATVAPQMPAPAPVAAPAAPMISPAELEQMRAMMAWNASGGAGG